MHCEGYCSYWATSKCFLYSTWIKAYTECLTGSPSTVHIVPVRHSSIIPWQHLNYCGLDAQMTEAICIDPPPPVPLLSFRLSGPRHPSGWLAISKFASHSSNVSFDSFMPSGDCQFYYPVTHSSVFSCTLFYFLRKLLNYFIFVSECTDC